MLEYYKNNKQKWDRFKQTRAIRKKEIRKQFPKETHERDRADALWRNFKITVAEYETMLLKHQGVCKICGRVEKNRRLAVDHCHKTGRIRGLLCGMCNKGLGSFKDSIELLNLAIKYLHENV